jgi:hypothetical protein
MAKDAATTIVSAQVPTQLRDLLIRQAHDADRTLSAEIRRALTAHAREVAPAREQQ